MPFLWRGSTFITFVQLAQLRRIPKYTPSWNLSKQAGRAFSPMSHLKKRARRLCHAAFSQGAQLLKGWRGGLKWLKSPNWVTNFIFFAEWACIFWTTINLLLIQNEGVQFWLWRSLHLFKDTNGALSMLWINCFFLGLSLLILRFSGLALHWPGSGD